MPFQFKILDDDYAALSLSGGLHTVEVQVVESIDGVLEEIEEEIVGELDCEIIAPASQVDPIEILTFAGAPAVLELGAEFASPAFTASYNVPPVTASVADTEGNAVVDVIADPESFVVPYTYTKTLNNEFVRWTLTAGDGDDVDEANQLTLWQPRVYWGTGAALGVGGGSEGFIEALAGSALQPDGNSTFAVSPLVTEKIFFAAPTSFGALQFFLGSPLPGGMFVVGSAIAVTPDTPNGVAQDYTLWESVSVGLGPTNVTVVQV